MPSSEIEVTATGEPEPSRSGPVASPRRLAWIVGVAVAGALGVVAIGVGLTLWVFGLTGKVSQSMTQVLDLVKLGFALVAGVGGMVGLVLAYQRHLIAVKASTREAAKESREETKLFNERFGKAAEQIASESYAVQLAGVYAMAKLADDWDEGRQTCIDVLCSNLRRAHADESAADADPEVMQAFADNREVRHTIIAVIATRLRKPGSRWQGFSLNFRGAHFDSSDFTGLIFSGGTVDFDGAVFSGVVDFSGAEFSGGDVNFRNATFSGGTVRFGNATFSGSTLDFDEARFSGSTLNFRDATFAAGAIQFCGGAFADCEVDFGGATFSGSTVDFRYAEFYSGLIDFGGAKFSGGTVDFFCATFAGGDVQFTRATFAGTIVNFRVAKLSSGSVAFRFATFPGGTVDFANATISGGNHDFAKTTFCGGTVDFAEVKFSGGNVDFGRAGFSGGTVNFVGATFSGSNVDFQPPADWSVPPVFGFAADAVPTGVRLPDPAAPVGSAGP